MLDVAHPPRKPDPAALLAWYDRHARVLPWRARPGETVDPYAVWLSEVMLQQTTVAAVKPFYTRFLDEWPDAARLAAAPVEDVMRAWAGLGYYSRARNLHACAAQVVAQHGGRFPGTEVELRRLPGIGAYTAAAIAAIAFGERAIVIDGNVDRVITRLHAIETPLLRAKAQIRGYAEALTPQTRPGDFAQAMMDLGATICTPRAPACGLCPFNVTCQAHARLTPLAFPVRAPRTVSPERVGAVYFIADQNGAVMVRTRAARGLLGGMSELPGTDWIAADSAPDWSAAAPPGASITRSAGAVRHVFTHFALTLQVYVCAAAPGCVLPPGARWVAPADLAQEAFPTLMRKALACARNVPDQDMERGLERAAQIAS